MTQPVPVPQKPDRRVPWNLALATLVLWAFFALVGRDQPPEFMGLAMLLTLMAAAVLGAVARSAVGREVLDLDPHDRGAAEGPGGGFIGIVVVLAFGLTLALSHTPPLAMFPATVLLLAAGRVTARRQPHSPWAAARTTAILGVVLGLASPWMLLAAVLALAYALLRVRLGDEQRPQPEPLLTPDHFIRESLMDYRERIAGLTLSGEDRERAVDLTARLDAALAERDPGRAAARRLLGEAEAYLEQPGVVP